MPMACQNNAEPRRSSPGDNATVAAPSILRFAETRLLNLEKKGSLLCQWEIEEAPMHLHRLCETLPDCKRYPVP